MNGGPLEPGGRAVTAAPAPPPAPPAVTDAGADARFRELARARGSDPDDPWLGGYVAFEWTHGRHVFETSGVPVRDREILEFGCNVGATSIVLAALGARVTAVDVDPGAVALAEANAARHGLADRIRFRAIPADGPLPFPDSAFDAVTCNSVLEYVPAAALARVQRGIDRVLRPGGVIFVLGTSSRIWPREVHSRRWLVNWLPAGLDRILGRSRPFQRGIFPWKVRYGFGPYVNLDARDGGRGFLEARRRTGMSGGRIRVLTAAAWCLRPFGFSLGMLLPNISARLQKPV